MIRNSADVQCKVQPEVTDSVICYSYRHLHFYHAVALLLGCDFAALAAKIHYHLRADLDNEVSYHHVVFTDHRRTQLHTQNMSVSVCFV